MSPEPIDLVSYDPHWPAVFVEERSLLERAFGVRVIVEHVGSTAVPGLRAKPIVDLMVGVADLAEERLRRGEILSLGYRYHPELEAEIPDRRFFIKRDRGGVRSHHLHVVLLGSEFWIEHLLVRDLLRLDAEAAKRYEALKVRLARRHRDDRKAYVRGKASLIGELLEEARRRLRRTVDGSPYRLRAGVAADARRIAEIEAASAVLLRGRGVPESMLEEVSTSSELEVAAQRGGLLVVVHSKTDDPVGFALTSELDGDTHLEELDVHPSHGRRGLGRALVERVCREAVERGARAVTLTTFHDVPFNAPLYAACGFSPIPSAELPPSLRRILEEEARRGIDPERRIAMRWTASRAPDL